MTDTVLVSAVIKARNEQSNLPECIASLHGLADEILVVDDGSTDDTVSVARALGARVISGEPHGGNINRLDVQGFLASHGRYILRLDADERVTPGLARRLRTVAAQGSASGVRYARRYYFFDGWLDHGGWFRSDQLGFFRRDAWDRDWNCDIHSQVPVAGSIEIIPAEVECCMLHLDYYRVDEFIRRSLLNYARIEAKERLRDGERFSAAHVAWRAMRRSAGRFVIRGGYRDGGRGAVVAGLLAAYEICIGAYGWEMGRQGNRLPEGGKHP